MRQAFRVEVFRPQHGGRVGGNNGIGACIALVCTGLSRQQQQQVFLFSFSLWFVRKEIGVSCSASTTHSGLKTNGNRSHHLFATATVCCSCCCCSCLPFRSLSKRTSGASTLAKVFFSVSLQNIQQGATTVTATAHAPLVPRSKALALVVSMSLPVDSRQAFRAPAPHTRTPPEILHSVPVSSLTLTLDPLSPFPA